ncbi:hypothetical protein C8R45DRAFT_1035021 [Mycena sanguinolenta]|nr:hypothetical protein C8R45DRAFT_1035021 [Mycena sanguinolenta]
MAQPTGGGGGRPWRPSPTQGSMGSFPPPEPSALQGTALAALIWVAYDLSLTLDSEVRSLSTSPWSVSKCLYLFLRYNSLFALAFYFMETLGVTQFSVILTLPPTDPHYIDGYVMAGRIYIATTEILCVLFGEALILLRINALYGWNRKWVVFTVFLFFSEVGIVTTTITLRGGSTGLSGSTEILNCSTTPQNLPDVNIGPCTSLVVVCIYFTMVFRMIRTLAIENGKTAWQILWAADLLPTIHLCLRDSCAYFLSPSSTEPSPAVLLMNLVLLTARLGYAQIGTPSVAFLSPQLRIGQLTDQRTQSTRIFLNLKYLSQRSSQYNSATWSEFERASVMDFREVGSEHVSRPGP